MGGTQSGEIRLYSAAVCSSVNGIWSSNGECLKKEGGSWSWDCGQALKGQSLKVPLPTPRKGGRRKGAKERQRGTRRKRGTRKSRK